MTERALPDCPVCTNAYLAIRTDLYKDKREFVYCDCCGAMATMQLWIAAQPLAALEPPVAVQEEGDAWQPIETAPKDGTFFIALVGGLPYKARFDETDRFIRMAHTNRRGYGRRTTVHHVDGKELIEVLTEGEDDRYDVTGLIWSRGFDFEPTHWTPMPAIAAMKGDKP